MKLKIIADKSEINVSEYSSNLREVIINNIVNIEDVLKECLMHATIWDLLSRATESDMLSAGWVPVDTVSQYEVNQEEV